jgi:CheY-like chemotaxis protein
MTVNNNKQGKKSSSRVLIVDDEPDIITLFELALRDSGFEVDSFNDPLAALSNFKPCYYDLVILDIKMPKINGLELCAEMKKKDDQIKICFLTAGEMYYDRFRLGKNQQLQEGEQEQYCKLNNDRFLQKPISNGDLVKNINKILLMN